jgi:uncharacterized membrane protein
VKHDAFGWPVVVAVSALAVGLTMVAGTGAPVRPMVDIWFLAVCPGMAFVPLLAIEDRLTELTIGIGASLAIDTVIAEGMVYTKHWSATWSVALLVGIACAGATWQAIKAATAAGAEGMHARGTTTEATHRGDEGT